MVRSIIVVFLLLSLSFAHGFPFPGSSLCRPNELDSPDILVLGLVTLEDAEQLFDV